MAEAQANGSYGRPCIKSFVAACCGGMLQLPLFLNSEGDVCGVLGMLTSQPPAIAKHLEARLDETWAVEALRQYTIEVYSLQ
jgi:hypothetical protein